MKKILAIDDKKDNLVTLGAVLKNYIQDCTIITALNGPDGIDMAAAESPDVIILDVKMPGMNGFDVCRELKSRDATRHIPVILLTAIKTDMDSRVKGLEIGADAFLTKPVDEAELVAQINVMLRIKKAEDLLRDEKRLLEVLVLERTMALGESERSLMEERDFIRSLGDASPAYFFALGASGGVKIMNKALLTSLGYDLADVIGKSYTDFTAETDANILMSELGKLVKSGGESYFEMAFAAPGGKIIIAEWHGRPFYRKNGELDFIFFVGIDVTERKRLEKILINKSVMERHEMGQALHDGLAGHLAAIAFKSEILKLKISEKYNDDVSDIDEIIGMVNQAADRARSLARDLSPVDVHGGGLASALDEIKVKTASSGGANCMLKWDGDIVLGDFEATQVYYIIKEAVENAVIHGRAKNIIISLGSANNIDMIRIIDDGVGIPDSIENNRGIGLKLMYYRSWMIGASFHIQRNDGGGTVVTCALKRAGYIEGGRIYSRIKSGSAHEVKKTRIFIVDAYPIIRQGLTQIINHEEDMIVCGEAQDPNRAVQLIAKLSPEMVLVDIFLEGSGGLDLIKALKARYPKMPVLALSIHNESLYAERALRVGARGFIMKQEAPQTVVNAIRTVLQGKQYFSENVMENILTRISSDEPAAKTSVDLLTDREFEIFQLIGLGYGNLNIAEKLNISVKTVENFREHIKNKLNLKTSSDLLRYAIQWMIDNKNR
jgi:PAS domain S-box-containing protein